MFLIVSAEHSLPVSDPAMEFYDMSILVMNEQTNKRLEKPVLKLFDKTKWFVYFFDCVHFTERKWDIRSSICPELVILCLPTTSTTYWTPACPLIPSWQKVDSTIFWLSVYEKKISIWDSRSFLGKLWNIELSNHIVYTLIQNCQIPEIC